MLHRVKRALGRTPWGGGGGGVFVTGAGSNTSFFRVLCSVLSAMWPVIEGGRLIDSGLHGHICFIQRGGGVSSKASSCTVEGKGLGGDLVSCG